jgi:hypothetical protein
MILLALVRNASIAVADNSRFSSGSLLTVRCIQDDCSRAFEADA